MASITRMEFQELGTKLYPNKIAKFSTCLLVVLYWSTDNSTISYCYMLLKIEKSTSKTITVLYTSKFKETNYNKKT